MLAAETRMDLPMTTRVASDIEDGLRLLLAKGRAAVPPDSAGIDLVGDVVGGYEVTRRIADGGMSTVYLARSVATGEMVAIKAEKTTGPGDPTGRSRFLREIGIHSKITSARVPRFYAAGTHRGIRFIVMDYIAGRDLATILSHHAARGRRLPIPDLLRIARSAFEAIQDLACLEVVHRDIKPANLLVSDDGTVRLCDLGLARYVGDDAFTDDLYTLGTGGYMSPEQWNKQPIDQRSDLYSMGLVLLEMAGGFNVEFRSENRIAINPDFAIGSRVLSAIFEGYPSGLEAIVRRCLHNDRRLRYLSAQGVVDDLSAIVTRGEDGLRDRHSRWLIALRRSATPSHLPEIVICILLAALMTAYVVLR